MRVKPSTQFRPVETLLTDGQYQKLTIVSWRNIPISLVGRVVGKVVDFTDYRVAQPNAVR